MPHDDADSPKKRTNSVLSVEAHIRPGDMESTTAIFRSSYRLPRDVGRPGLARTSYIQVYKAASTSMVLESSRTRGGRRRKNRPRGTVLLICCFVFRGERFSYERGESLSS